MSGRWKMRVWTGTVTVEMAKQEEMWDLCRISRTGCQQQRRRTGSGVIQGDGNQGQGEITSPI